MDAQEVAEFLKEELCLEDDEFEQLKKLRMNGSNVLRLTPSRLQEKTFDFLAFGPRENFAALLEQFTPTMVSAALFFNEISDFYLSMCFNFLYLSFTVVSL